MTQHQDNISDWLESLDLEIPKDETIRRLYGGLIAYKQRSQQGNSIKAHLEFREGYLAILEKQSDLEKRSRKFMPQDPTEPWITYWLSAPIAHMLSEEQREEWLGDLQEVNREMMRKDYPEWMISIVNVGQIIRLIVSSLDIKIVDLILKLRGKA